MTAAGTAKLGVGVSAILIAAAAGSYMLARQSDPGPYRSAIETVQEIQQLAAEWSVEIARVKADPLADYDALAAPIPRMNALQRSLADTVQGIRDIAERLANDVSAYTSAVDAKEERIERFKSANSVVRNSARYLPLAAAAIVRHAEAGADLRRAAGDLATDIDAYLAAPTDAEKGRLKAVVERLAGDHADGPVAEEVAGFVAHADVLLEQQAPAQELFERATSNDIANRSTELIDYFTAQYNILDERNAWYQYGTMAAAGGLLLLWVMLGMARTRPAVAAAGAQATTEARPAVAAVPPAIAEQPSAEAPIATEAPPAAPAFADAAPADPVGDGAQSAESERSLVAQRVLADAIGQRIAAASRNLATATDGLPLENGDADALRQRADEIGDLAERLSAVSKRSELRYELLDVNDCVTQMLAAADADSVARVVLETPQALEVFASRTEVCLMLKSVLDNSVQAIRDKGNGEKGEIRVATRADDGKVAVTVIDNGVGMAANVRERMFDPFFAANPDRAGVGLTFATHLLDKYGGSFSVSSHEGGGTVARIEMPGMSTR